MLEPKYLEQTLTRFAKAVVKQAKTNLTKSKRNTSKKLYNSLDKYYINVSKNSFELSFKMEDYGAYLDKGVEGVKGKKGVFAKPTEFKYKSKMPPTKALDKWIVKKGIKGIRNEKGQFVKRDSLKFAIARSIYNYGIPQTLFFTKPFETNFKRLPQDIISAFRLDVDKFLNTTNNFKKKQE